jgi:tetratricopeptide (TPR) repeat protein
MNAKSANRTQTAERAHPAGFAALALLALAVCAVGLYLGRAPILSPYPEDWIGWARSALTWSGVFAIGVVLLLVGVIGAVRSLLPAPKPHAVVTAPAVASAAGTEEAMAAPAEVVTLDEARPARGALKFDADRVAAIAAETNATIPTPPAAHLGVESLEPAIFHDNASDSFMSQAFNASAALDDKHGLKLPTPSAEIIPIRPDISVAPADPLEAALLAETPEPVVHRDMPTDLNAVITSTLRFAPEHPQEPAEESTTASNPAPSYVVVATPEAEVGPEAVTESAPTFATETVPAAIAESPASEGSALETSILAAPMSEIPAADTPVTETPTPEAPAADPEADIRQAVQMALSVWPDSTRAIAADELSVRIAHLYYDPAPDSARAFHLIASGDLSGASSALQQQANALAEAGQTSRAAEIWRVVGALHMGRDDSRAMNAYEHVSALDAADANIHLYLARRYQMSGEVAKQPEVLRRALYVISDPDTRAELLAPYADLMLKAGEVKAGGDALEELSRLNETASYLKPDDLGARSTYAISVARLAQVREMQGAYDQAAPLYQKAHRVFADLSALKPEHPGLRAMADKARQDAQRFQTA